MPSWLKYLPFGAELQTIRRSPNAAIVMTDLTDDEADRSRFAVWHTCRAFA